RSTNHKGQEGKAQRSAAYRCSTTDGEIKPAMTPRILFLGSKSGAVALCATRQAHVKHISATLSTGKRLPRIIHLFILLLIICFTHTTRAITLERVLQTTLEKNPAIQEAKSGLEQAAGQRLV